MKKTFLIILIVLMLCIPFNVSAVEYSGSSNTYKTYTYDDDNKPYEIPSAYDFLGTVTNDGIYGESFGEISDLYFCSDNNCLYIVDSAKNRIFVMNSNFESQYVIDGFNTENGRENFSTPGGITARNGILYISDTGNSRIVALNSETLKTVKIYSKPAISQLGDDYVFKPTRLAVGITGQIYVIGKDINSGFISLDSDGNFQAFVGAPKVQADFLDKIWKMFMTKKQKEGFKKSIPTEYNAVTFDSKGFLFATTQSDGVQPVVRLNLQGQDILKYTDNYPQGDGLYGENTSTFVDVCVNENGVYYLLDSHNGRVFTYNKQGDLLFAFGMKGNKDGQGYSLGSMELIGDKLITADTTSGKINIYTVTEFARQILDGEAQLNSGNYAEARENWQQVLDLCPSYTLAVRSFGKLALYQKDYKSAMTYFKEASDKDGYSDALNGYRNDLFYNNYKIIIGALILVVIIFIVLKRFVFKSKAASKFRESKLGKGLSYATYCNFHPFDGFWCLKREKRGNLLTANVIMAAFFLVLGINTQFNGYLFINGDYDEINELVTMLAVAVIMASYCVSNWGFTSLMDGKGTMKEIYIALCVALKPYIYGGIILFLLSHILTLRESAIYAALHTALLVWVFALIFFGMMMTHDYSLGNGIKTAVLTIIGMALIIFVGLIITNLIEEIIEYFIGIYRELLYRNLS